MRVAVIGNGWAALGAVASELAEGHNVVWVKGLSVQLFPLLASVDVGPQQELQLGSQYWLKLAEQFQLDIGALETGSWLREFKNKSFREPKWEGENRDAKELWAPEQSWAVGKTQARFALTLQELENEIRKKLNTENFPSLELIERLPVVELENLGHGLHQIILGSGEKLTADCILYADRWTLLHEIQGLPKALAFLRNRHPMGILQAHFSHPSIGEGKKETYVIPMHRESGESFERNVWGYFSASGTESTWSVFLSTDEVENNHEIAKKLRRMKNTLARSFQQAQWIEDFVKTVTDEQVRFQEDSVFTTGEPPMHLLPLHKKEKTLYFLTDGYGPSWAMYQVYLYEKSKSGDTHTQTEDKDVLHSSAS